MSIARWWASVVHLWSYGTCGLCGKEVPRRDLHRYPSAMATVCADCLIELEGE